MLPRRTKFSRKTAWQATEEQVVAANVDVVFIVTSVNEDLNLRRLERYLILARESGAEPVVAAHEDGPRRSDVDAAGLRGGVRGVRRPRARGLERDRRGARRRARAFRPGVTAALLGSSGVGKSTLINRLVGEELPR